jgi:hypothetical protein
MKYVIFKDTSLNGKPYTILVNDSEGIPMEFEDFEVAEKTARLFETNSHVGSRYTVKQIN